MLLQATGCPVLGSKDVELLEDKGGFFFFFFKHLSLINNVESSYPRHCLKA